MCGEKFASAEKGRDSIELCHNKGGNYQRQAKVHALSTGRHKRRIRDLEFRIYFYLNTLARNEL